MGTIAFVDTETLGLDPDKHAVWEVGLVLHDEESGGSSEHLWQIRLTPNAIEAGDPVGMDIGRFAERYNAEEAVAPWEFCRSFVSLTEGSHLAGNVVSFDEERLRRLCLSHGVKPAWHYHLIDVENIAVGALSARGESWSLPWKSDDLSKRLGVDPDTFDRHTALADARWARAVYLAALHPVPPEGWKEALPTMTGAQMASAFDAGATVERLTDDGWEPIYGDVRRAIDPIDCSTFVARVVPAPPSPRTEKVPVLDAIAEGRQVTSDDGAVLMDLSNGDVLLYRSGGRFRLMFDDAGHAEERRPAVDADGCVLVLARSDEGGK